MSNQHFGRWTLISKDGPQSPNKMWLVRCTCGTERAVVAYDLRTGKSKSCGCDKTDLILAIKAANTKHGMDGTSEYRTWVDMRRRCHQSHRPDYKNYGARGIYVCDAWRDSFEAFYRDMGPRPTGYVLDRRNNDGPYSPENCQWVPRKQQERNKRTNHLVTINGETLTVIEASERFGISAHKLYKLPKLQAR